MWPAGSRFPQRFTPYGGMVGAPLFNDNLVNTRKDYTYMEPTTGADFLPFCNLVYDMIYTAGMLNVFHVYPNVGVEENNILVIANTNAPVKCMKSRRRWSTFLE